MAWNRDIFTYQYTIDFNYITFAGYCILRNIEIRLIANAGFNKMCISRLGP
jgi:hypothetical protein